MWTGESDGLPTMTPGGCRRSGKPGVAKTGGKGGRAGPLRTRLPGIPLLTMVVEGRFLLEGWITPRELKEGRVGGGGISLFVIITLGLPKNPLEGFAKKLPRFPGLIDFDITESGPYATFEVKPLFP